MDSKVTSSDREVVVQAESATLNHEAQDFKLPSAVWDAIAEGSGLKQDIEAQIALGASKRVAADKGEMLEELKTSARHEGRVDGQNEGMQAVKSSLAALDAVAQQWLMAQQNSQKAIEKMWADAMIHVLKGLYLDAPETRVKILTSWISGQIQEMSAQQVKQVFLSMEDLALFRQGSLKIKAMPLASDETLRPGEARLEFSDQGELFSLPRMTEELQKVLNEMLSDSKK